MAQCFLIDKVVSAFNVSYTNASNIIERFLFDEEKDLSELVEIVKYRRDEKCTDLIIQ